MTTEPAQVGFCAILGLPNVGKSTLLNRILGLRLVAVSPKPQTTRKNLLGILTLPEAQVVFVDTPGIHRPLHKLGTHMVEQAIEAIARWVREQRPARILLE